PTFLAATEYFGCIHGETSCPAGHAGAEPDGGGGTSSGKYSEPVCPQAVSSSDSRKICIRYLGMELVIRKRLPSIRGGYREIKPVRQVAGLVEDILFDIFSKQRGFDGSTFFRYVMAIEKVIFFAIRKNSGHVKEKCFLVFRQFFYDFVMFSIGIK